MAKKNIFDMQRGFLSLTILVFSFIVTVIFGIIGYHNVYAINLVSKHPLIAHWCDVTYSTFRLFSLSGIQPVDMNQHWAISIARLSAQCTVFSSIALATIFSIGSWFRSNILIRFYKGHYVVIGMNKESYTLVNDLLEKNEKIILIHDDESTNVDVEQLKKNGVAIIHENITSLKTFMKAAISKSKAIIAISDNDLVNLSVMQTIIESSITDKITCYARLDNDISYKLFEPGAYYSIENIKALSTTLEINTFNINDLIAIDLVHSLHLGIPGFSIKDVERQIQILIMGFGEIGQAIFKELLLMCHFSNGKKVKLTVVTNSENEKEFFSYHHQILLNSNNQGLDLWDIELLDNDKNLQKTKISRYEHIISAYEDDNKALSTILRCYDLFTIQQMREKESSTTFHYYSKDKHDIKHDIVKMFGDVNSVCTKSRLVQLFDEETVRKRHEQYAKALLGLQHKTEVEFKETLKEKDLHENNSTRWLSWENQPLFKRLSNFTAYRHSQIKLLELGQTSTSCELDKIKVSSLKVEALPYISDFPELEIKKIEKWCSYIIYKKKLNNDDLIDLINKMAKAEHNRWNAFHVLYNWRYGSSKNERLKTHDCLLSWENLEKFRPDTIKYDYKNIYDLAEYITCTD